MNFDRKILLITAGIDSFGSAVLKRLLNSGVKKIRIFRRWKTPGVMRIRYRDPRIKFRIGHVPHYGSVLATTRGVDYVFHAAALKQVPSCEFFPLDAVKTNILDTANVLEPCVAKNVARVFCISTGSVAAEPKHKNM